MADDRFRGKRRAPSPGEGFDDSGDQSIGRVPPQDLDAERSVLGSMLLSSDVIDDVLLQCGEDDFYADANRLIFGCVRDMYDRGARGIDIVTVKRELEARQQLDEIGGAAYLAGLVESPPFFEHAGYYGKIVRDKRMLRLLIDATRDTLAEAYGSVGDVTELVAMAEKRVYAVAEGGQNLATMGMDTILDEAFERIYARLDEDGESSGLKTGFLGLDEMISGFRPSELLVLAARPSMGKTALVCNFALAVGLSQRGCVIFSLEQSRVELAERLLCIHARINGHKLRQGTLSEVEQYALQDGAATLKEAKIFVDDSAGVTMSQIAAVSRRLNRRHGIGLVIIDYLQLIETEDKGMPREQQIASITRRLKFLAKDLDIPVIALAQLNRGVEQREDKRPKLSDLRESGAIEQDADIVMFLHRPEAYDPEDRPGEGDLIVAKNRSGPIGTVGLTWLREQLRFADRAQSSVPDDF